MADNGLRLMPEEIMVLRLGLWKERSFRMQLGRDVVPVDDLDVKLLDYLKSVVRLGGGSG